ncbi:MAG: F0F1 ATP synthase subunit epsilon [Gemmatimonadota bacterium]
MPTPLIHLKVLLPFGVFVEKAGISRIVAETHEGSVGLLPRRLDCVAALVPGIFTYQIGSAPEAYVAVDQGVMVKAGLDVLVSVRRAISGTDLGKLRDAVEKEFRAVDEQEQDVRVVTATMEAAFLRRFAEVHDG